MIQKIINFYDTETEKYKLHQHKSPIPIDHVVINKILVYNKISHDKKDFKYFIDYKDAKKFKPFRRDFDKTKCESFLTKDEKSLEKYIEI